MIRLDEHLVSVIHYKKILKVEISEMQIAMKRYNILITGEELYIHLLNKDEIVLKGKILKVDFIYEGL